MSDIDADTLLRAYAYGVFPMAETRDDPDIYWIDPERRGVLPLDAFHLPRRLRRTVRQNVFEVRINTAFAQVIELCAEPGADREESWINQTIADLYIELHERGNAHSVECWQDDELVGGLYGVSLGAAFFGESMFSRRRDASKVALVHLVARLIAGGYRLLDTQFLTGHLAQFGAIEIPRAAYRKRLTDAIASRGNFFQLPSAVDGPTAVQLVSQTS